MKINTLLFPILALIGLSCSRPLTIAFQVPDQMDYQYKSLNVTNTTSKVMGQDVESSSIQEFDYTMKSLGTTTGGNHRIGLSYDKIKTLQSAMGQEMAFDSEGPKENNDPNTSQLYEAMLANPFELVYTPEGDIIEAPGMDKMLEAMFKEMPPEVKATLESQMNSDVFLQMFENMSKFNTNETLKLGDSWDQSQEVAMMGMIMNIDLTYTLLSRKDGKANIKIDGTVATSPESPGLEMMGMMMTYDLAGTQSGILIMEEATSWPLQMDLNQEMSGSISMDNPATGPMKIDMIIDTEIYLERLR